MNLLVVAGAPGVVVPSTPGEVVPGTPGVVVPGAPGVVLVSEMADGYISSLFILYKRNNLTLPKSSDVILFSESLENKLAHHCFGI